MLISIVTINKNNAVGLAATLQSVIMQTWQPLEILVVDGASTDDSIEIIKKYNDKIHWWVSEPDNGVYSAQNKGLSKTSGKYVLFLNSGDRFCSNNSLLQLGSAVKQGNEIIYGDILIEATDGSTWHKTYPDNLPPNYFDYETLPHPSSLIPYDLLTKYEGFDESLQICADWKFFRHVFLEGAARLVHIAQPISIFQASGISSRPENAARIEREKAIVKAGTIFKVGIWHKAKTQLLNLLGK